MSIIGVLLILLHGFFTMFGPLGAIVFIIPLAMAIWMIATASEWPGWIAYCIVTFLMVAPAIVFSLIVNRAGPGGPGVGPAIMAAVAIPAGFFWLLGSGIGFLYRLIRRPA